MDMLLEEQTLSPLEDNGAWGDVGRWPCGQAELCSVLHGRDGGC